ncbi:Endo-1,3-1,4-beta-glycanase ExsH [Planctomycetes bacterium CA13]|uniref:Endo-1,3-1,4-beta-glycanase ExsH n=1 Tax=Novipirellula herctigrandis TaxID=2527986 RepID=A0A5C5YUQ3_9BACT|nr:Endo-1,3-1,4-beta-glycanase ExsH [Planctomycetes bacterium CA13]
MKQVIRVVVMKYIILFVLTAGFFATTILAQEAGSTAKIDGYHEFNYGQVAEDAEQWTQAIRVMQPALRSEVRGDVTVKFQASGMPHANALCWHQAESLDRWGEDSNLIPGGIVLDANGNGTFVFPADEFPHGPVNVRIYAHNGNDKKDIFELQLFNLGGVKWNEGIPATDPPATKGMRLIYADDFDGPNSISNDGRDAKYNAHKPGGGDFSGWQFSNVLGDGKPFDQKDTWLRIAARKDDESPNGRSGIIASVNRDFEGVWAKAPCYMECRFTAQSAIGTWPAFWTLALGDEGTDELDIIEAYGGKGTGNPNHGGYSIVSHFWEQKNADGTDKKAFSTRVPIMELGGKSYWSSTFHTYGVYIGLEETVYYFDDIEVLRHPSGTVSIHYPHFFMVNYAIGGISGWPIDLERYSNGTDMWVDFVRVYAEQPVIEGYTPNLGPIPRIKTAAVGLNFSVKDEASTQLSPNQAAGAAGVAQGNWNNLVGPSGQMTQGMDDKGNTVDGLTVKWSVPSEEHAWRSKLGRDWGFEHANLKLQSGYIQLGGELSVADVPYKKYDVHVYLAADDNQGSGSVTISSPDGGVVANKTYYYWKRWLDGIFVESDATSLDEVKPSNCVVFRGITAKQFKIEWTGNLKQGWTGVSGIQIVAQP